MKQTGVGKVAGMEDSYQFITVDTQEGKMVHTSIAFTQAEIREEMKKHGLSDAEIDAQIANADANPA